ncbi:MAG: RNase adaptor protein RapZ, partial [Clostridia bacterium]|nr:RNase adaptor protein RapZ [Clostridia bacterium]
KTGLDNEVKEYVMNSNDSTLFLEKIIDFIDCAVPLYAKEGKSQLTIAFGCTGGKHRSVTFAELVCEHLKKQNYDCISVHRDIHKR